eukprot:UN24995
MMTVPLATLKKLSHGDAKSKYFDIGEVVHVNGESALIIAQTADVALTEEKFTGTVLRKVHFDHMKPPSQAKRAEIDYLSNFVDELAIEKVKKESFRNMHEQSKGSDIYSDSSANKWSLHHKDQSLQSVVSEMDMTRETENLLMLRVALSMTDSEMNSLIKLGHKIPSPTDSNFCLAVFLILFPKFKPSLCVCLFTILSKEKPKDVAHWAENEFQTFRFHTRRINKYLNKELEESMREPLGLLLTEISRTNPDWSKLDRDGNGLLDLDELSNGFQQSHVNAISHIFYLLLEEDEEVIQITEFEFWINTFILLHIKDSQGNDEELLKNYYDVFILDVGTKLLDEIFSNKETTNLHSDKKTHILNERGVTSILCALHKKPNNKKYEIEKRDPALQFLQGLSREQLMTVLKDMPFMVWEYLDTAISNEYFTPDNVKPQNSHNSKQKNNSISGYRK